MSCFVNSANRLDLLPRHRVVFDFITLVCEFPWNIVHWFSKQVLLWVLEVMVGLRWIWFGGWVTAMGVGRKQSIERIFHLDFAMSYCIGLKFRVQTSVFHSVQSRRRQRIVGCWVWKFMWFVGPSSISSLTKSVFFGLVNIQFRFIKKEDLLANLLTVTVFQDLSHLGLFCPCANWPVQPKSRAVSVSYSFWSC